MTYQEIAQSIQTLPLAERLSLLEIIAQSLQAEIQVNKEASSLARIRGLLKPNSTLPTDQELKDTYADYLIEKYA